MSNEPFGHLVIRASAGSGKTHKLTNRYLSLLAAEIEPDAILATTFTRKAAGEILNRVLQRLAKAAGNASEAGKLADDIYQHDRGPDRFADALRKLLRNLHRVRIGTLDSFYISLAGSFSLELGLPAGWSICEETDDDVLREKAVERLLEADEADILTTLYGRLTCGQTGRGVQAELKDIVKKLYTIHQDTAPEVWKKITVAPRLTAAELEELLARLEKVDSSKNSRMQKVVQGDLECARSEDWEVLLTKGLAPKVISGENAYSAKPISEEMITLYGQLIRHASSMLVEPLAEQTKATREFLDRFHRELWALKQTTGQVRFGDVTCALVDGVERQALRTESVAFRLDGAVAHLLLDEFQDTSPAQWRVLYPMARGIVQASAEPPPRSFFCVGDVKQAIFGWRGGLAGIIDRLQDDLGKVEKSTLTESRRSAQPIIDVVNQVFGNLSQFQEAEKCQDGLDAWAKRFERHSTTKTKDPGYVCLEAGPAQDGNKIAEQRIRHCAHVAKKIQELVTQAPNRPIGVLCRTNDTVARMIYELRQLKVEASEEGGTPLTDSPAVELILSLFMLADHPGHSAAWFHLQNSPLKQHIAAVADADSFAQQLRSEILANGYGPFTQGWAKGIVPDCDHRDLSRLEQLVEMAYSYQPRGTLRAGEFVAYVRQQRVPDPSSANVRVMTIHAAKGLQFDIVVLPELDTRLMGQTPAFVVGRAKDSLDVNFVCRYADEKLQRLLTPEEQRAFQQHRQQSVEESLSLLYVAMTRAVYAMHMYIPGPREKKSERKDAWYKLLIQTLAPEKDRKACTVLYEHGNAARVQSLLSQVAPSAAPTTQLPERISFRSADTNRRRGMEHMAPSRREGYARVVLDRLFNPSEGTGTAAGTLYHAWFATIAWLDDCEPSDEILRAVAAKLRADLPDEVWRKQDQLLANFRKWLQNPVIAGVLRRSAYADPRQPGFPAALATFWTNPMFPQQVEQERRFIVPEGTKLWNGSLDRVVWLGDEHQIVAADVLDFKTDAIAPGEIAALADRTEHYRPQLEAYRQAVAHFAQLPQERVATRLVFAFAGCIREI